MNQAFRKLLSARAAATVAAARALASVNHAGLKGALRETLVRDLLLPLLPPQLAVGHGVVVTAYDDQSTEQDVLVFNRSLVPPVLLDSQTGLFPLESVLYAVEVKSVLNAQELSSAHSKAQALETFRHIPNPGAPPPEHVIPCLFAFGSDLTRDDELVRYQRIYGANEPAIRSICVVERGYWCWNDACGWQKTEPSQDYAEILAFASDLLAVSARVTATRSHPSLREYVM